MALALRSGGSPGAAPQLRACSLRETLGNAVHPSTNSGLMPKMSMSERLKA